MFNLFHKKKKAKKTMNIEDMTTEEIQQYLVSREQKEREMTNVSLRPRSAIHLENYAEVAK